jgi:anthranilate synthase component 1
MIGQARYHARAMNDSAPKHFVDLAAQYDLVPVSRRVLSDHLTPVLAYRRLVHGDARTDTSFLLESVEVGGSVGRFSIVAAKPVLEVSARRNDVTLVDHRDGTTRSETHADPLEAVRAMTSDVRAAPVDDLVPGGTFRGGWAGWLSYDTVRWLEPEAIGEHAAPTDDRGLPDMHLGLYESVVVFDHVDKTLSITCWADLRSLSPEDAWRNAQKNIDSTLAFLAEDSINLPAGRVDLESSLSAAELPGTPSMPRATFEGAVERCIEYIRAGDIFQVVPSQRFERISDVDPFDVYRSLRVVNPSPYMIYMQSPDAILIASSPEILCKVEGDEVTSRPLAGTRRRGGDEAADVALEQDLLADEKERAEHSMLVDLARNDLGTVCRSGTVAVDRLMDVERYSHVMHISSTVSGQLKQELDCWDALRRSLPVGTVSGAPKIRAMQIIDELEPVRRGPYAGGIGYVSFNGDLDVAIALRTIVVPALKPGPPWSFHLQAGAGVVLDSIPAKEYEETVAKAAALGRAIDLAEVAVHEAD